MAQKNDCDRALEAALEYLTETLQKTNEHIADLQQSLRGGYGTGPKLVDRTGSEEDSEAGCRGACGNGC